MSTQLSRFGPAVALILVTGGAAMAQPSVDNVNNQQPVKPTGPAAKKADELIRGYTARIEKEIEQGRKEVERLAPSSTN